MATRPTTRARGSTCSTCWRPTTRPCSHRYGRLYLPHREPRYLRRNALVVLANAGRPDDPAVAESVRAAVIGALGDADPIVRAHAVWASRRLGLELPDGVIDALRADTDPMVRAELARDVAPVARR